MSVLLNRIADAKTIEQAFVRLETKKRPGPDGMTKEVLGNELGTWIGEVSAKLLSGEYQPGSVRRVYKVKADGKERPIAMANVGDKVVQGAVLSVLAPIVEPAFFEWSACRAGLGADYAADSVYAMLSNAPSDIIKIDIANCFGSIGLGLVEHFLSLHGIDDDVRILVDALLSPSVVDEAGEVLPAADGGVGIEQGLPLSPLAANLVLHHVLDGFVENLLEQHDLGPSRYLDDVVLATKFVSDPEALLGQIRSRMGEFGLRLHPKKTRIVPFGPTNVAELEPGARASSHLDYVGWRFEHGRLLSGGWAPFRTRLSDVPDQA